MWSIPHVFNHCHYLMGLIRMRYGEILKRIRRAIPRDMGDVFLKQQIPGDPEHNCPDLSVVNHDRSKIIVVDVTIPFETDSDGLSVARQTKLQKYDNLKTWLQEIRRSGIRGICCGSTRILGSRELASITPITHWQKLFQTAYLNTACSSSGVLATRHHMNKQNTETVLLYH